MLQLTHVRLLVNRFDDCLGYYRDVLGLDLIWGEEGGRYADFRAGDGSILALFDRESMAAVVGRPDAPDISAPKDRVMLIFAADNVDDAAGRVLDAGAEVVSGPEDRPEWGIRVVHLRDPDGNLIELNQPLPKEQWTDFLRDADERYGAS